MNYMGFFFFACSVYFFQTIIAWQSTSPPRGWNSWNSYKQWVNETQLLAQADFMVEHGMHKLGWEYVISDGGWYYPSKSGKDLMHAVIDKYGRYIATPDRYPSGWKSICDSIHSKGLKCGFHLFRGIPARAWEESTPIKGSPQNYTARDAGFNPSIHQGHGAFYEINMEHPSAQQYLDTMFELYCNWGIDFIKLDGVGSGRKNESSYKAIQGYRASIDKYCGNRNVIISLSAGGPGIPFWPDKKHKNVDDEYVSRVNPWVQMIRVTPDTWDIWDDNDTSCPLASEWAKMGPHTTTGPYANVTGHSGCCWGGRIVKHFEEFAKYAHLPDTFGVFPDGDMLQMGRVGSFPNITTNTLAAYGIPKGSSPTWNPITNCTPRQLKGLKPGSGYDEADCPRMVYLDLHEQKSLFTLWSIARSPLMMGGDLVQSPKEVIDMLTNTDVLEMNAHATNATQLFLDYKKKIAAWKSSNKTNTHVAVFNTAAFVQEVHVNFTNIFSPDVVPSSCSVKELWTGKNLGKISKILRSDKLPRHGSAVFLLKNCKVASS